MIDDFPNIKKALFLITLDNGGLNRDRSEEQVYAEMDAWIKEIVRTGVGVAPEAKLKAIDDWIGTLTDEQLDVLTSGEETEMEELQAKGPAFVGELLNTWFEGPC